jgi:hypothetical protein
VKNKIRVPTTNLLQKELKNFHAKIYETKQLQNATKSALQEIEASRNPAKEPPLNILFIGLLSIQFSLTRIGMDSTSHASFYRQLPKTVSYLSKSFTFMNDANETLSYMRREFEEHNSFPKQKPTGKTQIFEMNGYTIVGDGTTAQLTGILTGSLEKDLPEGIIM